jgi:hypothetical protein
MVSMLGPACCAYLRYSVCRLMPWRSVLYSSFQPDIRKRGGRAPDSARAPSAGAALQYVGPGASAIFHTNHQADHTHVAHRAGGTFQQLEAKQHASAVVSKEPPGGGGCQPDVPE